MKIKTGKDNPILRKPLSPVTDPRTKEIRELIRAMRKTMREASGIGLAANQIGKDLRLCVIELPPSNKQKAINKKRQFYALINPEIVKTSKEKLLREEGCLSLPGLWGVVPRFTRVTVKATSPTEKAVKLKATGLLAHALQHELDHLEGILFIDKAKEVINITEEERMQRIAERNLHESGQT